MKVGRNTGDKQAQHRSFTLMLGGMPLQIMCTNFRKKTIWKASHTFRKESFKFSFHK